jgi:hypothetical protein
MKQRATRQARRAAYCIAAPHVPSHAHRPRPWQVLDLNKRISSLGIKFSKNLSDENTKLYFAADELRGMPDDFLEG